MTEPRFFSPIFVHHRGAWHHAPTTYANGADTACGLSHVPGHLIAINSFTDGCPFGRFRAAVAEYFGAEIASAPMCPACFPGLREATGLARLSANLADFVVGPPSEADPVAYVQANLLGDPAVVRIRLTLASGAGCVDVPLELFHCAQPKEVP